MSLVPFESRPASNAGWVERLRGLSATRRLGLLALLCFLVSLSVVGLYLGKPEMKPLISGVSEEQASQVVHKLEELKVDYQLTDAGSVLVPASELKKVRLELASSGLPDHSEVGFSLFDRVNLQMSEFTEKVNYTRALQGELAETIKVLPGISKVRVHLNLPDDSLLAQNRTPPSASVLIQLKPGARLSRSQCRGILRLVASSVEGLKSDNVTLTDSSGTLLYSGEEEIGQDGSQAEDQLSKSLQKSAQGVLDNVLGPGRGVVSVRVELNKELQRRIERTVIEPNSQGQGFEKSRKVTSEEYVGTYKSGGGQVTATAANVSAGNTTAGNVVVPPDPGPGQRPTYKQNLQQMEFDYSRRIESQEESPNCIRRITASVVVDAGARLDANGQTSLKNALALAIGIDGKRGDEFSLSVLPFSKPAAPKPEASPEGLDSLKQLPPWLRVGVGLASLALMAAAATLLRKRRPAPASTAASEADTASPETPQLGSRIDIALPAESEPETQEEAEARNLLKLARAEALQNPELVARVIQLWVNSERARR